MSKPGLYVVKRDGSQESMDVEKIHRQIERCAEGLTGVSVSDVMMHSKIQLFSGMKTSEIDAIITKAAADLISEETPNYQYLAARLEISQLRKSVFGSYDPIPVKELVLQNVARGLYTRELLEWYEDEDWVELDRIIKHRRDLDLTYTAVKQLEGKYLAQDRSAKQIYETPQYLYLLVAATIYGRYPKSSRLMHVKELYDATSRHYVSLPTPIMAGVRSPKKQFSSCVLIECDDSLDSINATASSIVRYVSKRAGIGVNVGRIRAVGSRVGNGEIMHTGVIPYYRLFQSAVKSCSQGGVRGGAATFFVPIWHREIEDILVLKNNKGIEDNRVRRVDYGIQVNTYLVKRLVENRPLTLFSPHEVNDLYEAFFEQDSERFTELYERYERDPKVKKKQVPARDLFFLFMNERAETGRVYSMLVDEANRHSPFKIPVRQSNLCMEIALPTEPLTRLDDDGTELARVRVSRERLDEYLAWRAEQGSELVLK